MPLFLKNERIHTKIEHTGRKDARTPEKLYEQQNT